MDDDAAEPRVIWSDVDGRGGEFLLSRDDVARIWQAAMTDWLADRQKGYRKGSDA